MNGFLKKIACLCIFICFSITLVAQDSFKELSKKGNDEITNGNYAKALEYFDAAIKSGSENQADVAWIASVAAACAQQLNDDAKAVTYYKIAIRNQTLDETVYEALLELSKKMNDDESYEETLLAGRKILKNQYRNFTNKLLYFYYNKKKYEKIPAIADEVLGYRPEHITTNYIKGVSYLKTGKEDLAVNTFQQILSKDSADINTNKQLGFFYFQKGTSIYEKAKTDYNALKAPTRMDYASYRKEIANAFEPYRKAAIYLERAYSIKPGQNTKKALFSIFTRLELKDKAALYK